MHPARLAVTAMAGLFGLTYSLVATVSALALAGQGLGAAAIGANAAMHALGVLAMAPVLPALVARAGGRRLVLAALAALALVLLVLAAEPPVWTWFALRVVVGMAAEVLFVMSETWSSALSPAGARGRAMAAYMTAMSLGFAAGPAVAALTGSRGTAPFLAGLACTALTMLAALHRGIPQLARARAAPGRPWRPLRLAPLALASGLLNAAVEAILFSFLPLYAMALGWAEEGAAGLLAALGLGAIALQLPLGWLADRMERRRLALGLALACGAGALAWPALLPVRALAGPVLFVWGGLFVGIYTTLLAMLADRFEGGELVGIYAAVGLSWGVGMLVGPAAAAAVAVVADDAVPLAVGAACLVFAAFVARSRARA